MDLTNNDQGSEEIIDEYNEISNSHIQLIENNKSFNKLKSDYSIDNTIDNSIIDNNKNNKKLFRGIKNNNYKEIKIKTIEEKEEEERKMEKGKEEYYLEEKEGNLIKVEINEPADENIQSSSGNDSTNINNKNIDSDAITKKEYNDNHLNISPNEIATNNSAIDENDSTNNIIDNQSNNINNSHYMNPFNDSEKSNNNSISNSNSNNNVNEDTANPFNDSNNNEPLNRNNHNEYTSDSDLRLTASPPPIRKIKINVPKDNDDQLNPHKKESKILKFNLTNITKIISREKINKKMDVVEESDSESNYSDNGYSTDNINASTGTKNNFAVNNNSEKRFSSKYNIYSESSSSITIAFDTSQEDTLTIYLFSNIYYIIVLYFLVFISIGTMIYSHGTTEWMSIYVNITASEWKEYVRDNISISSNYIEI